MLLRRLVHALEEYQLLRGSLDVEISKITDHSAQVLPQSMFVCVSGYQFDGHNYVVEAVAAGAVCIVTERPLTCLVNPNVGYQQTEFSGNECQQTASLRNGESSAPAIILVTDTRKALAKLASSYYGDPASRLCIIGVTGTKGKTTTACMIRRILCDSGIHAGLIGTLGAEFDGFHEDIRTTTPDALTLHRMLSEMEMKGCTHVVLEVSSQSLMQHRVFGIRFQIAVFTNLFPDHIGPGEHSSIEEYAFWKSRLFVNAEVSVINMGADRWEEMASAAGKTLVGYYLDHLFDGTSRNDRIGCPVLPGRSMQIGVAEPEKESGKMRLFGRYTGEVSIGLPGRYNLENALAALTVANVLGLSLSACEGLAEIQIPGRTELLEGENYRVVIDYAHNESSMENLLTALRHMSPKRLICIYGSGGNRSVLRRIGMGRAGGRYCDLSVLTEDNSRNEPLSQIIDGLIEGIESVGGKYLVIPDRKEAIHTTIKTAMPGDLIAIIGKGHETYQEIGSHRYPFSDREEARLAMRKRADLFGENNIC